MVKKSLHFILAGLLATAVVGCGHHKNVNPIANVDSKQPDKVLFDRSMQALADKKYETARITLQTLINAYPDSEYIARAKLGVGDSWYLEGSGAALIQAEAEYKDFITFFPNMPEAAEAQLKVAGIHYKEMEKPDRDYTHAKRAEEEYRQLIQQFPDSKLVPEAKARLREVQEVLAEREYRIGHFYFLRESWPATIARLMTLTDQYPLYSQADEALFELGQGYEKQAMLLGQKEAELRSNSKVDQQIKTTLLQKYARLKRDYENSAGQAYAKIITRYPEMDRVSDARSRLQAMKLPVPTPTAEAIAQNQAEEQSREELSRWSRFMLNMHKHPDVAQTAKVGEPPLEDIKAVSAPEINRHALDLFTGKVEENVGTVSVETLGTGQPPKNQAIPRSDNASPALRQSNPGHSPDQPSQTGISELKVDTTQPSTADTPKPAPRQVNEAQTLPNQAQSNSATAGSQAQSSSSSQASSQPSSSEQGKTGESSSKKKKRRLVPW